MQKTQQWVLRSEAQEYAVMIPTKYKDFYGWADSVDRFIHVVKQMNMMHSVSVGAIVGPAHVVQENARLGCIDCVWLVNHCVDADIY